MSITWSDVSNLDAALTGVPGAAQTAILTHVALVLNATRWGTKLDNASTFLAAHLGALVLRGGGVGGVGPLTQETLADASRSYAALLSPRSDDDLDATIWGKVFKRLRAGTFPAMFVL